MLYFNGDGRQQRVESQRSNSLGFCFEVNSFGTKSVKLRITVRQGVFQNTGVEGLGRAKDGLSGQPPKLPRLIKSE